jgi:hypothetical protein
MSVTFSVKGGRAPDVTAWLARLASLGLRAELAPDFELARYARGGWWPLRLLIDAAADVPGASGLAAAGALATGFWLGIRSPGREAAPALIAAAQADAERHLQRMTVLGMPDVYIEDAQRRLADIAARRQQLDLTASNDSLADWVTVIAAAAAFVLETDGTLHDPFDGAELRGPEVLAWMRRSVGDSMPDLVERLGTPFTDWAAAVER